MFFRIDQTICTITTIPFYWNRIFVTKCKFSKFVAPGMICWLGMKRYCVTLICARGYSYKDVGCKFCGGVLGGLRIATPSPWPCCAVYRGTHHDGDGQRGDQKHSPPSRPATLIATNGKDALTQLSNPLSPPARMCLPIPWLLADCVPYGTGYHPDHPGG